MRFCLAGTEFKMESYAEAGRNVDLILSENPEHLGANQLKALVESKSRERMTQSLSTHFTVLVLGKQT